MHDSQSITLKPIGIIHTPFTTKDDMPIQPSGAKGIKGTLILNDAFIEGLANLGDFSHNFLIYVFHKVESINLIVTPFLDKNPKGVFATRAPTRPNPIGLSVVKLLKIENNTLFLENVDMLDGTPVIDIKPYVPNFDQPTEVKSGCLEKQSIKAKNTRSDDRFT